MVALSLVQLVLYLISVTKTTLPDRGALELTSRRFFFSFKTKTKKWTFLSRKQNKNCDQTVDKCPPKWEQVSPTGESSWKEEDKHVKCQKRDTTSRMEWHAFSLMIFTFGRYVRGKRASCQEGWQTSSQGRTFLLLFVHQSRGRSDDDNSTRTPYSIFPLFSSSSSSSPLFE